MEGISEALPAALGEAAGLKEKEQTGEPTTSLSGDTKSPGENGALSATNSLMDNAERFAALFNGHDQFYGVYNAINPTPDEKGKLIGAERRTVRETVTIGLYEQHLDGQNGLGIIPVRGDSTVLFGAIDIDQYAELSHKDLAHKIAHMQIPLVLCRSKSGGAHCYLFAAEPIPAALMIARLKEVAAMLGRADAEIFPKQKAPTESGGSWINLPYFDGMLAARYALRGEDGGPMDLEEFLAHAESLKRGKDWFDKPLISSVDLPQGPPCLQHLIQIGFPQGTRNTSLFNLGVYCRKADPDNWKATLEEMNRKFMQPPLDNAEVRTVIKSVGLKKYFYTCDQQPIAAHCNKALCRTRTHGIGMGGALPEFGPLKKILTDPPTWVWTVNNLPITLNTDQLLEPWLFKKACANSLSMCMSVPKQEVWDALVAKAMAPENLITEEAPEDSTPIGRFTEELGNFCAGRNAFEMEGIKRGLPFCAEDGYTYFRLKDLITHLAKQKFIEFRLDAKEVSNRLRELRATSDKRRLLGQEVRYWRIASFPRQTTGFQVPDSVTEPGERPF